MPQLDVSTYASQAFWIIVCFCFLWAMIAVFVTPKIADILEQRKRLIDEYLRKAEKLNIQAKDSLSNYNQKLDKAKALADAEMQKEQSALEEYLWQTKTDTLNMLNKKIADNELKLAKEKKATFQQIETLSLNLASDIVKKLGFANISKQDIANANKEK